MKVNKKLKKLKIVVYRHKLSILLIILAFVILLNFATIGLIMYKKDNQPISLIIYKNQIQFTIQNNIAINSETMEDEKEEEPFVIVKGSMNDKEDGEKLYTDTSTSNAQIYSIQDAISLYEAPGTSIGIDVSKYQGNINWKQVKDSGIEFAIIRCGYRGYGSGQILMDPYFEQNIQGALTNGIRVGIYFFSAAINEAEAEEEARWVVNVIKKYRITYPVAYDFESFDLGRLQGLTSAQITNNAIAFLNYIKLSGYTPMMYASKNAYNQKWETSRITGCKFWLAHYTDQTDYKGAYQMWQYTSKGSVPGINGYVDMNIAYFTYSNEAPAIEEEKEKEKIIPPSENQQVTINFNELKDNIVTISNTEYFNDYNTSASGTIESDTKLERIAISEDGIWSKIIYNNNEIYVKTDNIKKEDVTN